MSKTTKTVLIIGTSTIAIRGIIEIINEKSHKYEIIKIHNKLDKSDESIIRALNPDLILIDPISVDPQYKTYIKLNLTQLCNASVIAYSAIYLDEESQKQYDDIISIYDEADIIVRKINNVLENRIETPKSNEDEELSIREKEILVCVAKGMLNKEIADKSNISIYTVITHRKNITKKLGIKTVAGLTLYAIMNNLIDINSIEDCQ